MLVSVTMPSVKDEQPKDILRGVQAGLDELLLVDQARLRSRLRRLRGRSPSGRKVDPGQAQRLWADFCQAGEFRKRRQPDRLRVSYPAELPISSRARDIAETLAQHQVVIVCGATGSGKTTQLPKIALEAGLGRKGRIGVTQPRRLAATSMAQRVAQELNCSYGGPVGCQIRFDDQTSDETVIKFMTDGVLLAETQNDRWLLQYDALIIDEAHERSLNIDFALGYLKNLLPRRRDLKVVISSATLDVEAFSEFFDHAPIVEVQGRVFSVEDVFLPTEEEQEELSAQVLRAVNWVSDRDRRGDVLVFLPGEREIREAADLLQGQRWRDTDILPLFARLSMDDQRRVFKSGSRRRIVLATNVAETSITIPNIHVVVDSGQVRISRYNPHTQVQALQVEQVSQASARQRRGRCGRVREGICIHLYEKEVLEGSPMYTDPEILRTSLAGVILQMKVLGLAPIDEFPFIDPPRDALIREGYRTLRDIKALDREDRLTAMGRDIAAFALDPRLARMICQARIEGALPQVLAIASFLSIQDPRERPATKQAAADEAHASWVDRRSDFFTILNLWNFLAERRQARASQGAIRRLCQQTFLNYRRVREWYNLWLDLREVMRSLRWKAPKVDGPLQEGSYDAVHRSLLSGVPANLGVRGDQHVYQGARDRRFHVFPGSGLFEKPPKWLMAFSMVQTTKLYARLVAEIDPTWLEDIAPHLCRSAYRDIHWSSEKGFVSAREVITSGGLLIHPGRIVDYGRIDAPDARRLFIRDGMVPGDLHTDVAWLIAHRKMLNRICSLEAKIRRPGSLLDNAAVFSHFDGLLPPTVCSVKSLETWLSSEQASIDMNPEDAVLPEARGIDSEDYPDEFVFHGHAFRLAYKYAPEDEADGVCLLCPSDLIALVPEWAADWLIPGWLPEKVRLLIRSLPKNLRMACSPANRSAAEFADAVKRDQALRQQPLLDALAAHLGRKTGQPIAAGDFDPGRLPNYLTMKVAEIDARGRTVRMTQGMPPRAHRSSELSGRLPSTRDWTCTGKSDWPAAAVPETVALEGKVELVGYPALVDEGATVGQRVFLNQREALASHRQGLLRLFRMQFQELVRPLEKTLPMSWTAHLALRGLELSQAYTADLADAIIWAALSDEGKLSIRDADTYRARAREARGLLSRYREQKGRGLDAIMKQRSAVLASLQKATGFPESIDDIRRQLAFLFRPGFLKMPDVWDDYPRYLKALDIRIQRLSYSQAKDRDKLAELLPLQERLDRQLQEGEPSQHAYALWDYAALLQEFRIALFAPEVGTRLKVSTKRVDTFWNENLQAMCERGDA